MVSFELVKSVFVSLIEVKVRQPSLLDQTATLFQLIQVRETVGRVLARHHLNLPVVPVNHQAHHEINNPRPRTETLRHQKALRRERYGESLFRHIYRPTINSLVSEVREPDKPRGTSHKYFHKKFTACLNYS